MKKERDSAADGRFAIPVEKSDADWLEVVRERISSLRFGSVTVTVHDGRVVQVETSVKVRFERGAV